MAAPPPSLINKEARHQVFVEGHKTHIAGTFVDFIRKMDAALRERWGRVDLPDSMAERIAPAEVERLKKLVGHVREDMRDYYGQFYDVWREQIVDFAAYEAGWEVRSNKATFGVEFDLPARAQLRSAVLSTPLIVEGINKGDLLREFYADWAKDTVNAVDAIIRGGYYQGLTNTQIARQVFGTAKADFKDGVWGRAQRDVMALTRTAVQHAASQARREVYELNSDIVVGVQIVSTLDDRTTPLCQSLDGRIFELGEAPMPPYHIGCRTTTIPVLDPAFAGLSDGATRIAHGSDGSELVPADMTYFEWLKTQPADFQDAAIGPKRGELLRNGGISAERFSELNLNRNFEPRTLEEMRKLEPLAFERVEQRKRDLHSDRENRVLLDVNPDADIYKKLGEEHYGELHGLLNKAPDAERDVWGKMESELKVYGTTNGVSNFKSIDDGVELNVASTVKGTLDQYPYQEAVHEFAHDIDRLANVKYGSGYRAQSFSGYYNNGIFEKTIKDEVNTLLKTTAEQMKVEFNVLMAAGDINTLVQKGYITTGESIFYKAKGVWPNGRAPRFNERAAYKQIADEINALPGRARYAVSDIIGGATRNRVDVKFGHSSSYWKTPESLAREAFAEMYDSTVASPESLEQIKKYLPKSYATYQEMIIFISKGGGGTNAQT